MSNGRAQVKFENGHRAPILSVISAILKKNGGNMNFTKCDFDLNFSVYIICRMNLCCKFCILSNWVTLTYI